MGMIVEVLGEERSGKSFFKLFIAISIAFRNCLMIRITVQRRSDQRCSIKKFVLKNFAKLTGKDLYFYNKVAGNTFFAQHLRMTASEYKICVTFQTIQMQMIIIFASQWKPFTSGRGKEISLGVSVKRKQSCRLKKIEKYVKVMIVLLLPLQ